VRALICEAHATKGSWVISHVHNAALLLVADALKVKLIGATINNDANKKDGGSAPWQLPLRVEGTTVDHEGFKAIVFFLCAMVDASDSLPSAGHTLTTVCKCSIDVQVGDKVPTSMTHQFFAAMVRMCWIGGVFISSGEWGMDSMDRVWTPRTGRAREA